MQSIADQLRISKNSVYLALNAKAGVGDALRAKVIDTARQMGYGVYREITEPELLHKSRCLILVIPEYLTNDMFFYADIMWAIESEAMKHGLIIVKRTVTTEDQQRLIMPALPEDMGVIGFLIVGVLSESYVERLYHMSTAKQQSVVSVDIPYYDAPVSCVCTANHAGGYAATRHLIQRGHTAIGFIGPVYAARSVYERWSGFRQAMEEEGCAIDERYNIIGKPGRQEPFKLFDTQEALMPSFERLTRYPTAWFCAGDRVALATMNLLTLQGLNVPRDVSIIGFDDLSVAQIILPKLTTMHVRRRHMGQLAVQQLIRGAESHQTLSYLALPCTLVERDSVRDISSV